MGHLSGCGCSEDLALLELWMVKATALDSNVPKRNDAGLKTSDMNFSQAQLKLVQASLTLVSGLTIPTLLQPENNRLSETIMRSIELLTERVLKHDNGKASEGSHALKEVMGTIGGVLDRIEVQYGKLDPLTDSEEDMDMEE